VTSAIRSLKPNEYGAIVIDSVTHIWEACMAAYVGNTTRQGNIPAHAWGQIKKPYKDLVAMLLSIPQHVIICGRQGNDWDTDEEGKMTKVGVKMKAETETPYEPHILIRMEAEFNDDTKKHQVRCYVDKDRTGILMGKVIVNPTFDSICKPLMHLLGDKQAAIQTSDEVAAKDHEAISDQEKAKERESAELLRSYKARMELAGDVISLDQVAKELTPDVKRKMLTAHVEQLKEAYLTRSKELVK
jgi:hypothetical protein